MKTFKGLKGLAVGACVALALSACGGGEEEEPNQAVEGDWDSVVSAANEEGNVMLYSSQNPVNLEALKKAFEREYPDITMEFVRGTDAELNPKVDVEKQTGKGTGDVHMLTDAAWIQSAADSGDFSVDIVGPDFDAEAFNRAENVMADKFFLTSAAVFAMGWNTDAVSDGFTDPTEMLSEEYSGKIGITNPQGIGAYVDFYNFYEESFGPGFLEDLAQFKPRIYPSALGIAQALTSGEIVAAPGVQPLVAEVDAGAPVDWTLPDPAWGTPWFSHVLGSAPNPNAAQVLANFMVTEAGQAALNTGYASVIESDTSVASASGIALPDPAELTPEKVTAFQQEWEALFLS